MHIYQMTDDLLQSVINQSKQLLLAALENDGAIVDSDALSSRYAIIVVRKGWLGSIIDKTFKFASNGPSLAVVKMCGNTQEN